MTQTNHQPWTCGVCFWLFACDSEFVQLSCLWQRVTPEFDIVTAGKGMMTFHLRNVTAVSSNCKLTTTIINSPYFLVLASPLLSPWRIYASCLTCTGRPCPAPTRWVTWLSVKLDVFQMWQVSRASAAALSTVLRTTTLSYGNMRFSGIRPAETPQPIKMKFCKIDYVGELTRCAKNGWNRLAGAAPQISEI